MSPPVLVSQRTASEVVDRLHSQLIRTQDDERPVVVMTCGIAGAGKTTLSKEIMETYPNFQRLSIDEIIASQHGIYNVDYAPEKYKEYQTEADGLFLQMLQTTLAERKNDVILDRSFYSKEDRDEFKSLIEKAGTRRVLIYLKVSQDLLWKRIVERRENGVNANSALDISKDLFNFYLQGFEHPDGEGEIVVEYVE